MGHHTTLYKLRNHAQRAFSIEAKISQESPEGTAITATIEEQGKAKPFTYVVEFSGDFIASKPSFNGEMYLHTAVSVIQSQLESLQHRDTRLRVHHASGLIETSPL